MFFFVILFFFRFRSTSFNHRTWLPRSRRACSSLGTPEEGDVGCAPAVPLVKSWSRATRHGMKWWCAHPVKIGKSLGHNFIETNKKKTLKKNIKNIKNPFLGLKWTLKTSLKPPACENNCIGPQRCQRDDDETLTAQNGRFELTEGSLFNSVCG